MESNGYKIKNLRYAKTINLKNNMIELLSCSADGSVVHWTNRGKEKTPFDYTSWIAEKVYTPEDKNHAINILETLFISSTEKYFVIFSANSFISIYYFDEDLKEFFLLDKVKFKKLQDAMTITPLNESYLLLLSGGYDSLIHVYLVKRIVKKNQLLDKKDLIQFKVSLSGHVNDIRDISAISSHTDSTDEFYFATCSQDTYIRIWQVNKLSTIQNPTNDVFEEYKSKTSYVISASEDFYNITLDSVLSGHEEAVSSVRWGRINNQTVLLSSSFDFTVGVWSYDKRYVLYYKIEHME
jgi:WD40 repeat protein